MVSRDSAPLAGVRVLAVEQFGAGPFASLFLADLGAEVIKIEEPGGGDVGRSVPPGAVDGDSLYFEAFNRGKRSIALDLKTSAGHAVFARLVATADAVFNNLRGDVPERLGLTYPALGAVNPRIICVSLSAYGRSGARASEPGYDALIQAEAGWAALTGEPGGPPVKSGLSLVDYAAGLTAALGLVSAIVGARRTGVGGDVDASLYDVALSLLSYPAAWLLSAGISTDRQPLSAHPSIVPFQFFETADGYLAVACAKERFFHELATLIGRPELVGDPRFASFTSRGAHRQELIDLLAAEFRTRATGDWLELLRGRVPCAPVRAFAEALDPDELTERGMLASYPHPRFGQVYSIGRPIKLPDHEPRYRAAPRLDADREALLTELGYTIADIAALRAEGAFGIAERDGKRS